VLDRLTRSRVVGSGRLEQVEYVVGACCGPFPHVDVFVTNGGFGSVLAAIRHGVPLVAAGKTEGKSDINARIGHNHLGIDLGKERPKPSSIRAALGRVLADLTFSAHVEALRAELESYDPLARIEAVLTEELLPAGH
jgi:UDP:flavonoid glycosyltransferase YjiC (YdhE family)